MNTILLIIALIFVPSAIGCGFVNAFLLIKKHFTKADAPEGVSVFCRTASYLSSGAVITLALAGAVNILSVVLHFSVSKGGRLFLLSELILFIASLIFSAILLIKHHFPKRVNYSPDNKYLILLVIASLIGITQIIIAADTSGISYLGDQTLETVNSFIATDAIYSVDPLTGLPYLNGYPFRLSLQCLPFLYSVLTNLFSVNASTVVWQVMPAFWLLCGYCTFIRLANTLFKNRRLKAVFLIICQLLLWCTDAGLGGTGFNLFHTGFSPVIVLELLLINWTIGTILSDNSIAAVIAIIAEPMIASTQYGVGACFFITLALIIIKRIPAIKRLTSDNHIAEGGLDGKN